MTDHDFGSRAFKVDVAPVESPDFALAQSSEDGEGVGHSPLEWDVLAAEHRFDLVGRAAPAMLAGRLFYAEPDGPAKVREGLASLSRLGFVSL